MMWSQCMSVSTRGFSIGARAPPRGWQLWATRCSVCARCYLVAGSAVSKT